MNIGTAAARNLPPPSPDPAAGEFVERSAPRAAPDGLFLLRRCFEGRGPPHVRGKKPAPSCEAFSAPGARAVRGHGPKSRSQGTLVMTSPYLERPSRPLAEA